MLLNRAVSLSPEHFGALDVAFRQSLSRLVESEEQQIVRAALRRFVVRCMTESIPSGA